MDGYFKKVRTPKDIMISVIIIAIGVIVISVSQNVNVDYVGAFISILGIFYFLIMKKGWKNIETGELCELISFYFPEKNKEIIKTALAEDTEKIDIKDVLSMSTLRLDVYYNKKSDKCFCQLLEFVPYHYSPCSVLYKVSYSSLNRLMK
jgi:hypothetical protein